MTRSRALALTALLFLILLASGCGSTSSDVSAPATTSANPAPALPAATTASLRATLDFGPSQTVLGRLPDSVTSFTLQVFSLDGQLLGSQSGTRTAGSGSVTVVLGGLPPGNVRVHLIAQDAGGATLGTEDQSVSLTAGGSVSLTFDTLTAAAPSPTPFPSASPNPIPPPSPLSSPSPSPVASPASSPTASPVASPSPAAPALTSLSILPATSSLQVGTGQAFQVQAGFSDGSTQVVSGNLTSSAPAILAVNGTTVQALAAGQATLSASFGGQTASLSVTVFAQQPPPFQPAPPPPPPVPTLSSLSPLAGPVAGGTLVTLTGTGFSAASQVTFGGTPATFTVVSDSQIQATSPAHALGSVNVQVGSATALFRYGAPTVSGVSPVSGGVGASVTVSGSGFASATQVKFGSTPAAGFTINSDTQITVNVPSAPQGLVDVQVANSVGPSAVSALDQFTVTWVAQTSGVVQTLRAVAYGASTNALVAVGDSGKILKSSNGTTWNVVTPTSSINFNLLSAAWSGNNLLGGGSAGGVVASTGGTNFGPNSSGISGAVLPGTATGNGFFLLVGTSGGNGCLAVLNTILTSIISNSNVGPPLQSVAFGTGSRFAFVGPAGVARFSNVTSFSPSLQVATSNTANDLNSVFFGNNLFVAVGAAGTIVVSSDNGQTYTPVTSGTTQNLNAVTFGNGQFVAVGDNGTVLRSTDGSTWTADPSGSTTQLLGVCYDSTIARFVAVGAGGAILTAP